MTDKTEPLLPDFIPCECGAPAMDIHIHMCGAPAAMRGDLCLAMCERCGRGAPYISFPYSDRIADGFAAWNARALDAVRLNAPEGWKLVPVEPTPAMLKATEDPFSIINGLLTTAQIRHGSMIELSVDGLPPMWHAYKAMLAAAPSPPVGA